MTQSQRILHALKLLSKHEEICTDRLSKIFETDKRTIQRDMKILREFLEDSLVQTGKGCCKLLSKNHFLDFMHDRSESKELKDFFEFLTFFDENIIHFFDHEQFGFIKKIKQESNALYHIHENPIEKLKPTQMLETLKKAIKNRRYIDLVYFEKAHRDFENVKPQKIVYAKGNWYLAAITKNYKTNEGFKFFRINFMKSVMLKPQTFHTDLKAEHFIKNFQSLFQNYSEPAYEVKLKVDKEVARHFKVKKYIKSQKIIDECDGNLVVTYMVNEDMEIIPLIRTWLPHLKIISPQRVKEKIKKDIKNFLNDT